MVLDIQGFYLTVTIYNQYKHDRLLVVHYLSSVSMAGPIHSRSMAEMFVELLHDEEDEAILSPDSESEISDDDDLDQWSATGGPRAKTGLPAIISGPRP